MLTSRTLWTEFSWLLKYPDSKGLGGFNWPISTSTTNWLLGNSLASSSGTGLGYLEGMFLTLVLSLFVILVKFCVDELSMYLPSKVMFCVLLMYLSYPDVLDTVTSLIDEGSFDFQKCGR